MGYASAIYGVAEYSNSKYSMMVNDKEGNALILTNDGKKLFNIEVTNV
jgi:hypothetical protein